MSLHLNRITTYQGILFLLSFVMFHIQLISSTELINLLINLLSFLLLIMALIGTTRFYLILSISFIAGSMLISALVELSWAEWIHGASYMLRMILFIGLVPLIAIPVQSYVTDLQTMIRNVSQKFSMLQVCNGTSFFLANLINMASLPICGYIFCGKEVKEEMKRSCSLIIIRSFGLAMLCTPIGAAVALAIDLSGGSLIRLLALNLCIACLALCIAPRIAVGKSKSTLHSSTKLIKFRPSDAYFLIYIICPFTIYFLFLIWVSTMYHLGIMELILVSILPYTLIWNLCLRKLKEWFASVSVQLFSRAPSFFGQFSVIISSGLFIHTLKLSGLDQQLISFLPGTELTFSAFIYIPVVILIILFLAWIGVHQFVALAFVGELFEPHLLGIGKTVFASSLLVGFVAGTLASSFSGANLIISQIVPQMSAYEYAQKNYMFTGIFIGISIFILLICNSFIY